jgi:hypothetical protein
MDAYHNYISELKKLATECFDKSIHDGMGRLINSMYLDKISPLDAVKKLFL